MMTTTTRPTNAAQLGALVWLKWRLFRNALRSRRAALGSAASILGTILAVGLALLFAAGIGFAAYGLTEETSPLHPVALRGGASEPMLLLFGLVAVIFLMWSFVPLSMGGGSQFSPGQLLLYPISLRKLFLIDLLSELASLASIFAVPAVIAVGVGAGLAAGNVLGGLFAALLAAAFGVALAKLFSTTINSLMRRRRGRAETLVALVSIVAAMSGLIIQFGVRAVAGAKSFPPALLWTPPGALVRAVTAGLRPGGGGIYALSLATLAAYISLATMLTYRVAIGSLNSSGGASRSRTALAAAEGRATVKLGWQLPLVPAAVSTVFEKELRYAMRNAQLRTMMLMPVVMTVALWFAGSSRRTAFAGLPLTVAPYVEGARAALGVFYVFAITSAITTNCFGYDAAGMRALVLAPVARRHILAGKNLAMLVFMLTSATLVTIANRLVYGDLTLRALGFTALGFLFYAGAFFSFGNFFSVRFPRRMQYGKRMKASGMAGLLLLPLFLVIAAAPALAVLAGWYTQSLFVEYVILAAFALIAIVGYFMLLSRQGATLERRELDILDAVARRDED
jgi:hypothetical protein